MDEAVEEYESVPQLDLGLSAFVGGSLRPRVCDAMAFPLTLKTSMHCWQAHRWPEGEIDDVESVPPGYRGPPFPLELDPETPTPRSAPLEPPPAEPPPPAAPPGPVPQPWEAFGNGPETSG